MVTNLLADLVAQDLCTDDGLLVVIDGAKGLTAGVRKVFEDQALVRCALNKRRNVGGYLPREIAGRIDRRLAMTSNHPDQAKGLARARPSPRSSRETIPTRRPPSGRARRTCSPFAA